MKKYLFLALAAFAFASCSNDSEVDVPTAAKTGKVIKFDVYAGSATRGQIITTDSLKTVDGGFTVWAKSCDTLYFPTCDYLFNKSASAWAGPLQIWPDTAKVNFFFVAPAGVLGGITPADQLAETFTYNLPTSVDNLKDILWGLPQKNKTFTSSSLPVTLTHAMSHITFKVKVSADVDSAVLNSISMSGLFATQGKMNFGAGSSETFWTDTVCTMREYSPTPMIKQIKNKSDFVDACQPTQDLFIIPCRMEAPKLTVSYKTFGRTFTKELTLPSQVFTIGQSYQIQLIIDVKTVKFDVTEVPAWAPGSMGA